MNSKDNSLQFLLLELNKKYDYWVHVDKRIDNSINLFIALLTLIITTSFFLYEKISDTVLSNTFLISLLCILIISGYLLLIRLYKIDVSRSTAMYSINLIKRYFVDKNIEIEKYVYFHKYKPLKDRSSKEKHIKPKFHKNITYIILFLNGTFFGLITILLNNISSKTFISMFDCISIILGSITTIIIFGVTVFFTKHKFKNINFD